MGRLIHIFKVKDTENHIKLFELILEVCNDYSVDFEYGVSKEQLKHHRMRLMRIGRAARVLHDLLQAESASTRSMTWNLLSPRSETVRDVMLSIPIADRREEDLMPTLSCISIKAFCLVDDPELLGRLRHDPTGSERAKSVERRNIWEPTFRTWESMGHKLGFSANGPIVSAIRIFHEALGLPQPKVSAIEEALRSHKGRVRGSKKLPRAHRD